jgi:acetoin utilization deacetylase AcuC-like enzyme
MGAGAGLGTNINVPLPPGCGHGAYVATFERVVVPALEAFKPQLILVSSGAEPASSPHHARVALHAAGAAVHCS